MLQPTVGGRSRGLIAADVRVERLASRANSQRSIMTVVLSMRCVEGEEENERWRVEGVKALKISTSESENSRSEHE